MLKAAAREASPGVGVSRGGRSVPRRWRPAAASAGKLLAGLIVAAACAGLLWLVAIYANGLRDPRYLDGWVLAGGMGVQMYFHIATKAGWLSPVAAIRWRRLHILVGIWLIAAFISHVDLSLPDTALEWALGASFALVALSGGIGVYLAWSLAAKGALDERIGLEQIASRRSELARAAQAAVARADPAAAALALPAPPYDAWIADLHATHLQCFLDGPRNTAAHLIGSKRPLQWIVAEIDALARHLDPWNKEKLAEIKAIVIEKDQLDAELVAHALNRAWLMAHVPVTYMLIVLTVLHIVVVYAFSAGSW